MIKNKPTINKDLTKSLYIILEMFDGGMLYDYLNDLDDENTEQSRQEAEQLRTLERVLKQGDENCNTGFHLANELAKENGYCLY